MRKRVPQPSVNPDLRALEHHDFWSGFAIALVGAVLLFCGARHMTSVDTTDEDTASEMQLVKAFSCSGLQYPKLEPPAPPKLEGVDNPSEVLDRWAKQQATVQAPSWKIRVDVGAKTPCPT